MFVILNVIYIFAVIKLKTMEEGTLIQLTLPKDFNYDLDVHLAKLKRDGSLKKDKTKAQYIIALARIGLIHEKKNTR